MTLTTPQTNIAARARAIRRSSLKMVHSARIGHPGGDLSGADILATLYFHTLRIDPANPRDPGRDRFIMSKGHASASLYATLAERGFIPLEDLASFMKPLSMLNGHPDRNKVPGVEANTGPLGHGLPIAVGSARAAQMDGATWRTYVLTGDGELQEGSNWEAAMAASQFGLDNLTVIVDRNRLQLGDSTEHTIGLEPLADRWRSFGWAVVEVDGHDHSALAAAFDALPAEPGRPTCIIANTVKGRGVSFMENKWEWHHRPPNDQELALALQELADEAAPKPALKADEVAPKPVPVSPKPPASISERAAKADEVAPKPTAPPRSGPSAKADCRAAFADTLIELATADPRIVALVNDSLSSSNLKEFKKRFPDRCMNIGIAEQNLVGVSAGLAGAGKIPFTCSASCFLTGRALEQVKADVAYSRHNVKLCGMSSGMAYGELGATHHSIEDLAWTRALANMTVIVPADAIETAQAVRAAAVLDRPLFLRLSRMPVPTVHSEDYKFEIGRAARLRDGSDVTVIATGVTVHIALEAAAALETDGISAAVLNMSTIRPLDRDAVLEAAARGPIVTVEEHTVHGGLGSAVAEVVVQNGPVPMRLIGVPGVFAPTGSEEFLLGHFGISVEGIREAVHSLIAREPGR